MSRYLPVLILFFIVGCKGGSSNEMTEEEIDDYVLSIHDTTKVYDIVQGPRYSQEDGHDYRVTEYGENDTALLHNIQESTEFTVLQQNLYYKGAEPIFLEEFLYEFLPATETSKVTERKYYFSGQDVFKAYERSSEYEETLEEEEYVELKGVTYDSFDFDRPKNAVLQKGEFELKFDSFLIINPESYLILENDQSGWGIALFITEGDMLLDEMYENEMDYKGKTIFFNSEYRMMGGVERQIYRGGIVKEKS